MSDFSQGKEEKKCPTPPTPTPPPQPQPPSPLGLGVIAGCSTVLAIASTSGIGSETLLKKGKKSPNQKHVGAFIQAVAGIYANITMITSNKVGIHAHQCMPIS
jgi:hypothetical protein